MEIVPTSLTSSLVSYARRVLYPALHSERVEGLVEYQTYSALWSAIGEALTAISQQRMGGSDLLQRLSQRFDLRHSSDLARLRYRMGFVQARYLSLSLLGDSLPLVGDLTVMDGCVVISDHPA